MWQLFVDRLKLTIKGFGVTGVTSSCTFRCSKLRFSCPDCVFCFGPVASSARDRKISWFWSERQFSPRFLRNKLVMQDGKVAATSLFTSDLNFGNLNKYVEILKCILLNERWIVNYLNMLKLHYLNPYSIALEPALVLQATIGNKAKAGERFLGSIITHILIAA